MTEMVTEITVAAINSNHPAGIYIHTSAHTHTQLDFIVVWLHQFHSDVEWVTTKNVAERQQAETSRDSDKFEHRNKSENKVICIKQAQV